jgi:hypothetical protein
MIGGANRRAPFTDIFNHRVQPLCHRVTTMWLYPGPSCYDYPFSEELGDAKINAWIHKVLARWANLNPMAGPIPLREGVFNTRVSPLGSIF